MALKIAFTSCMDAMRCADQPVWDDIRREAPDALLLLGDQIYMDWGSLARVPPMARQYERHPDAALQVFIEDMHARYRAQWNVPQFRACMVDMARRGKLVMTIWDEHDFAWNNAYGAGQEGEGENARKVPLELQHAARGLFHQFQDTLRAGIDRPYPDVPCLAGWECHPPPGYRREAVQGLPIVVLDQRSYRTHRDEDAPHLLLPPRPPRPAENDPGDAGDLERLRRDVADGKGLLIVAGSSPMRHNYLLGDQGWWAPPDRKKSRRGDHSRDYPEYRSFIEAVARAQRPVIYLAGDIHRNSYGGPVEGYRACDGPIVQVLASGAGLGTQFFRRFPGSFSTLSIAGPAGAPFAGPEAADVTVRLHEVGRDPQPIPTLKVREGKWQDPIPEGACQSTHYADEPYRYLGTDVTGLLAEPLQVLCFRERGKDDDAEKRDDLSVFVDELDSHGFEDELPLRDPSLPPGATERWRDWPEVVRVEAVPTGTPATPHPTGRGKDRDAECRKPGQVATTTAEVGAFESARPRVRLVRARAPQPAEAVNAMLDQALATARRRSLDGKGCVVLFVHGFNKSFAESIDQALQFRAKFPHCEPVLYSWPTGSGEGGLLNTLAGFQTCRRFAGWGMSGVSAAVGQFGLYAAARPEDTFVLVARSMGAEALAQAVQTWPTHPVSRPLARVLLSAPACNMRGHADWVDRLPAREVVITINQGDDKLKYVRFADDFIKTLGNAKTIPDKERSAAAIYLDVTDVPAVQRNHDYLLRTLGEPMDRLNQDLVMGRPFENAWRTAMRQDPALSRERP